MTEKSHIFAKFARHVSSGKVTFFQENGIDFVFGRREGPYVWDIGGSRRLYDCHCNGGVFNLGHRHPRIVQALQEALQSLDIGNHHFVSKQRALLAERIAALTPGDLQYTVFGVSGGEAIDTAIKIARKATGRRKVLTAVGAYHGHTGLAVAAGEPRFSVPLHSDSPDFIRIPFNDLQALEKALSSEIAAVLLEVIPATLGMPIPDADYFTAVKELCAQHGALFIADEVQTGLGRTGTLWGIEQFHTVPDILVSAKGLSGGLYPITATVITAELERVFHDDPFSHISTFGGSELGCMVALEVLNLTAASGFLEQVHALARLFDHHLNRLREAFAPLFVEVRQKGLMIGLKFADDRVGPMMTRACFEAGLLCVFAANDPSVVQFLPPLILTQEQALEIIERLEQALTLVQQWIP